MRLFRWILSLTLVATVAIGVGVSSAQAATILTNFGTGFGQGVADTAGNIWNNMERLRTDGGADIADLSPPYPPLSSIADLVDSTGASTGISLAVTDPLTNNSGSDEATLPGFNDPDDGLLYEHGATGAYHFGRQTTGNTLGIYTLSNLDPNTTYDLKILSARGNNNAAYVEDFTIFHGGTDQMQSVPTGLNGVGGNYTLAKFVGLVPDGNNEIQIQIDGSEAFTYINFLRIDTPSVPEPTTLALAGLSVLLLGPARFRM